MQGQHKTVIRSRGIVSVTNGIISARDMRRADDAAQTITSPPGLQEIGRAGLYFQLATGEIIDNPAGRQSSTLESVWEFIFTGEMIFLSKLMY